MRAIILDIFRRWWWFYLLGFFLPLPFIAVAQTHGSTLFNAYCFAPFLGAPVAFDLNRRGACGALLTLPVSRAEIGRAYWLVAVGVPPVWLAFGFVGATIMAQSTTLPFDALAFNFTASLAVAGYLFFLLTAMPSLGGGQAGLAGQPLRVAAGLIWGVSLFAGFFLSYLTMPPKPNWPAVEVLLAVGLAATVGGYLRADDLMDGVAGAGGQSESGHDTKPGESRRGGPSGLSYLYWRSITRCLGIQLFTLPIFLLFERLWHNSARSIWIYLAWYFAVFAPTPYVIEPRNLRALPLSTDRLATLLLCLPLANLAATVGFYGLAEQIAQRSYFHLNLEFAALAQPGFLSLIAGWSCLAHAIIVRWGPKGLLLLNWFGIATIPIMSWLAPNLATRTYSVAVGLVMAGLGYGLLRQGLRSSAVYRNRDLRLTRFFGTR